MGFENKGDKQSKNESAQMEITYTAFKNEMNQHNAFRANNKDLEKAAQKEVEEEQIHKRDEQYTNLVKSYLDHYTKKSAHNRGLKIAFFLMIAALIAFICVLLTIVSLNVVMNENSLGIIITSLVTAMSTIISLTMIIANYLFPKHEDDSIVQLLEFMKNKDLEDKYGKNKEKKS